MSNKGLKTWLLVIDGKIAFNSVMLTWQWDVGNFYAIEKQNNLIVKLNW